MMLSNNFIRKCILGFCIVSLPFALANCSDDDGDGGPNVEKGTVDAQVSGSANLDLSGGKATFEDTSVDSSSSQFFQGKEVSSFEVTWNGSKGNSLTFGVIEVGSSEVSTGTYEPIDLTNIFGGVPDRIMEGSGTIDSVFYSIKGGSIKVTTKNSSNVIGKLQDVKMEGSSGSESVILNGAFHAQQ